MAAFAVFALALAAAYWQMNRCFAWEVDRGVTVLSMSCTFLAFAALWFGAGAHWACGFAAITSLFLLIDYHLARHFGFLFASMGKQLILVVRTACWADVHAYLHKITVLEWLSIPAVIAAWVVLARVGKNPYQRRIVLIALVPALYYSYDARTLAPVYAYELEMFKNGPLLKAHDEFVFHTTEARPTDAATYVIVIGESHRYDHFHVFGYPRDTTPRLDQFAKEPGFVSFDDMLSGYTITYQALPNILMRKPIAFRNNFFHEKSILSAFAEAGYKTFYLSYLASHHPFDDSVSLIASEANVYINHRETSGTWEDPGFQPVLDRVLADPAKKKLIVLKLIGVHSNFEQRYPAEEEKFKPSYTSVTAPVDPAHKDLLVNSYDNALRYSDGIIGGYLDRVKAQPVPSMIAFLSDHGTTLFDDGLADDRGLARGNYHIPFLIYGNDAFWSAAGETVKKNLQCNRSKPITEEHFFDTFVTLAGLTYPGIRNQLDLAACCVEGTSDRKVWTLDGRFIPYTSLEH